ncbi:helix-turn-helix domain-containing protein [Spirosoma luteum]|uniref:helix-turn-helix domain-containing protein n=1 Tax=Spirosoma luteum TaxID=431553 RepID=UPI001FDF1652|nr:helix-turn-helix domain-containing protein [Spirosoma luteum]
MKQPEGVMRQIVTQILLGQLNIDQAAERLKVSRQTVQRWMKKIEEEAEAGQQTAAIDIDQPPPQRSARPAKPKAKSQVDELRGKVLALEEQLEEANFKALYYSTLVRIAKHELGVDIEKKPPWPGPLPSHPVHADESSQHFNSTAGRCAASAVRLVLPGRATINIGNGKMRR